MDITHIHAQFTNTISKGVLELDKIHATCIIHAYFAPSSHKSFIHTLILHTMIVHEIETLTI